MATKYIFVTGGVVSSLGKGITAASLGRLLKARGYKVSIQKFDPYINVNPGNMSPYQHGEVFVTDDGAECDLDIGHYERFIDENLTVDSDVTSGQVYLSIIEKERAGDFQGATIQVIPHITNEIKRRIYRVGKSANAPDIVITEVGGTVGDIESLPFLEAIRQIRYDIGVENCAYIHVTLVPYLKKAGEVKTKPTQHSVKELSGIGIQPDFIICRCEVPLPKPLRDKIGLFCNIGGGDVIQNIDAESLYEVPLLLEEEGLGDRVCKRLSLDPVEADLTQWRAMVERGKHPAHKVRIALVGKYVELRDAYYSLTEALSHAGNACGAEIDIDWIASAELEGGAVEERLRGVDGVIVPGGFGERGAEGKVCAAGYARTHNVPFYAINMGMQMAVVEFARNVCGLLDANSTEHAPDTAHPVVDMLVEKKEMGDTMRLGKYRCSLTPGSRAYEAYGEPEVSERHRHRYEINEQYAQTLAENGMVVTGRNPELGLIEIIEVPAHPWYVGVQFNAEFKSRPNKAHPLLVAFVKAVLREQGEQDTGFR